MRVDIPYMTCREHKAKPRQVPEGLEQARGAELDQQHPTCELQDNYSLYVCLHLDMSSQK